MLKRVFLFVTINILVIVTISLTLNIAGVTPYLTKSGIDYRGLLVFCAIVGFAGAFISLSLSRYIAKMLLRIEIIDPAHPGSREESFLLDRVYRFAREAGIGTMPEVGIYPSREVNAFATGPGKNSALVAVSAGLLEAMDADAIEGVLAHEVAHVANGDMVTMTLIQGVINTFVMFFARIAAWIVASSMRGGEEGERAPSFFMMYMLTMVFEIFLSILGSIAVAYFSRIREFSADRDGALLAGRNKMIHALESLKKAMNRIDHSHESLATFKVNGSSSKLLTLLATHPPLDERIARLRAS